MELFLELVLTVSLSLIITSLFIKLVNMQPIDIKKHKSIEEAITIDRFQWMPHQEEVIKLEEPRSEGKTLVEFHNIAVADGKDSESNPEGEEEPSNESSSEEMLFEEGSINGGERNTSEIEIESIEEEEEGIERERENDKDEWVEIRRQDFEELLRDRGGSL